MRRLLLAALMLAPASAAGAQPPSAPEPAAAADASTPVAGVVVTARKPTHVAGVTVTAPDWCPTPDPARYPADHDPRVIDSYPAAGGAMPPGYGVVRITFDAPMSCYSEVSVQGGGSDDDPCEPSGTWALPDRRTWIMQCRWAPGARYTLSFRRVDGRGFVGLSGRTAIPYELEFTTTSAAPTPSRDAALLADPGAPQAGRTRAYVTCTDTSVAGAVQPCTHTVFKPPPL